MQGTNSSKHFLLKKKEEKTTEYRHRESNKGFEGYMFAKIALFLTYKRYLSQAYSSAY